MATSGRSKGSNKQDSWKEKSGTSKQQAPAGHAPNGNANDSESRILANQETFRKDATKQTRTRVELSLQELKG